MKPTSKTKLEELSKSQEEELELELDELVDKGKSIATSAIIVAGGLALSYMLYKALFESEKPKKKRKKKVEVEVSGDDEVIIEEKPSMFGEITGALAREASIFLLEIAKQKLAEYLNARDESAAESTGKE